MKIILSGLGALLLMASCSGTAGSDNSTGDAGAMDETASQIVDTPEVDSLPVADQPVAEPSAPAESRNQDTVAIAEEPAKKAGKPFTAKSLMKQYEGGYELKALSKIKSVLTEGGYELVNTESRKMHGFNAKNYIFKDANGNSATVAVISDRNAGVVDDVNEIVFNFASDSDRNSFTQGKKSAEFGAHDQVRMKVSGNTVKLTDDCYYC